MLVSTGCTKKEAALPAPEKEAEAAEATKPEVEIPATVREVMHSRFPDAEIDSVEVVEEHGITLYDIEFMDNLGEIEVAADGTILDVATIIAMEDLPLSAAEAIQKATTGMTVLRLEKSEIHSEFKMEGERTVLVLLDAPRYVYEAEVKKDGKTGEITVDADGNIVELIKWDSE